MKLSVVILAMTTTEELFTMTSNCINSLMASEALDMEVIVVESNKRYLDSEFVYPEFVKVIIPDFEFNFHRFLNIGIKESVGNFVALCNNDLIFQENWFSEMLEIANKHKEILSFSPNGVVSRHDEMNKFEIGYKVQKHIKGWCIVANRKVFSYTGYLDEAFDFYYADNDYAMSLKCNNIKHALVFNSHVIHLEKKSSSSIENGLEDKKSFIEKYKIPNYLLDKKYEWVIGNEKNLSGFLAFHNKWGSPDSVYRKNKLADLLIKHELGYFVKFFLKTQKLNNNVLNGILKTPL